MKIESLFVDQCDFCLQVVIAGVRDLNFTCLIEAVPRLINSCQHVIRFFVEPTERPSKYRVKSFDNFCRRFRTRVVISCIATFGSANYVVRLQILDVLLPDSIWVFTFDIRRRTKIEDEVAT